MCCTKSQTYTKPCFCLVCMLLQMNNCMKGFIGLVIKKQDKTNSIISMSTIHPKFSVFMKQPEYDLLVFIHIVFLHNGWEEPQTNVLFMNEKVLLTDKNKTTHPCWIYYSLFWCFLSLIQLRELQDKYAECLEMLHEAQEELKNFRNKSLPLSTTRRFHSLGLFPMVSSYSPTSVYFGHNTSKTPASTNTPLTILPCSSGFSGGRNRGHHEEGTSDGWSRCRRAKVLIFNHLWVCEWLPTTKCLGLMQTSPKINMYFFQYPLQTATKTSFPDSKKPEPNASAAVIARPVPSEHPRIQSDIMPHLRALQPGGHTALQLHLWKWGGKWDHPGQPDQQYSRESRWWVGMHFSFFCHFISWHVIC